MILYNWSFVLVVVMNKFLADVQFQFNASVIIITYLNSHLGVFSDRTALGFHSFTSTVFLLIRGKKQDSWSVIEASCFLQWHEMIKSRTAPSNHIKLARPVEEVWFFFCCVPKHSHTIICHINALMHQTSWKPSNVPRDIGKGKK